MSCARLPNGEVASVRYMQSFARAPNQNLALLNTQLSRDYNFISTKWYVPQTPTNETEWIGEYEILKGEVLLLKPEVLMPALAARSSTSNTTNLHRPSTSEFAHTNIQLSALFKRNSVYVATIFAGAFVFQAGFDTGITAWYEYHNRGKLWKDVKGKFLEGGDDEGDDDE